MIHNIFSKLHVNRELTSYLNILINLVDNIHKFLTCPKEFLVTLHKIGSNVSLFLCNKSGHYRCQSVIDVIGHKHFYFVIKGRK